MPSFNDARVRIANDRPVNPAGRYVLYWMQSARRLHASHALDHALRWCRELKKPLVVYEGLRLDYPWANARHHAFMLQGMRDNAAAARKLGIAYWPFVATPDEPGRGLVARLANDASLLISDDHPAYIVPAQNRAIAGKCGVAVHLVDGSCMIPLGLLGPAVTAAAHLRPRIHRRFAEAWSHRARAEPAVPPIAKSNLEPPFESWDAGSNVQDFIRSLPIDQSVPPLEVKGGTATGRRALARLTGEKLHRYSEHRNEPDDPEQSAASGLSPYLRHGHLAIQEVVEAVLGTPGQWSPKEINSSATGKRDDFYCRDANVNAFLDEAITWRDLGYHWHYVRSAECGARSAESRCRGRKIPQFNFETFDFSPGGERTLDLVLPEWAKATLRKHERDRREHLYGLEEFESAATHDDLWNAAQRELVATGRIHNYLRMLWGKKVVEWSKSPAEAYRILEHLNNKYAIDGRDPNSYSGILWCFGLFDRAWGPERPILGTVRYMSTENTARKFKLGSYFEYIENQTGERVKESPSF